MITISKKLLALKINVNFIEKIPLNCTCCRITGLNVCWDCVQTSLREISHNTTVLCLCLCNEGQIHLLLCNVALLACNILWLYAPEQVKHSFFLSFFMQNTADV